MKFQTKLLSAFLAALLLASCVPLRAFAAEQKVSYVFNDIQKYDTSSQTILPGTIDTASPGDVIVLTFGMNNRNADNLFTSLLEVCASYDPNVFAPYTSGVPGSIFRWESVEPVTLDINYIYNNGDNIPGLCYLHGQPTSYSVLVLSEANSYVGFVKKLAYFALQVKPDVTPGTTWFGFADDDSDALRPWHNRYYYEDLSEAVGELDYSGRRSLNIAVAATGVSIATQPAKTAYVAGQVFDPTGMVITANYVNGATENIAAADFAARGVTITPAGALTAGAASVTVAYDGKTVVVPISVAGGPGTATGVAVATQPTKTNYTAGQSFDPTGMEITVTYVNGATEDIDAADFAARGVTITPAGALTEGTSSVTVTYDGKTTVVPITVAGAPSGGGGGGGSPSDSGKKDDDKYSDDKYSVVVTEDGKTLYQSKEDVETLDMRDHIQSIDPSQDSAITITLGKDVPSPFVELPVADARPSIVAVMVDDDGNEKLIKESSLTDGSLRLKLDGSAQIKVVDNAKTFTDVEAGHWYSDMVDFVAAREIMNGTPDGAFEPDASLSRAMMIQTLYNLSGDGATAAHTAYGDVAGYEWYVSALDWTTAQGVVDGYLDGTFRGGDALTREQLAAMLYRYTQWRGLNVSARVDLSAYGGTTHGWSRDAVSWAVAEGLLVGDSEQDLRLQDVALRNQIAAVMTRFCDYILR